MKPDTFAEAPFHINLKKIFSYSPEIIKEVGWILKNFATPLLQKNGLYISQSKQPFSFSHNVVLFRSDSKETPRYAILEDGAHSSGASSNVFLVKHKLLADEHGLLHLKPVDYIAKCVKESFLVNIQTDSQREYLFSKRVKYLHCKEPVLVSEKGNVTAAFLIMRNLGPINLSDWLKTLKEHNSNILIDLSIDLIRALNKQVHQQNIIHRDIKPDNIIFDSTKIPPVRICDFGISKSNGEKTLTESIGTDGYMAPEQTLNQHTTKKTDITSLGFTIVDIWNLDLIEPCEIDLIDIDSFSEKITDLTSEDKETIAKIINSMLCFEPEKRAELTVLEEQFESLLLTRKTRSLTAQRAESITFAYRFGLEVRKKLDMIENSPSMSEGMKKIFALLDEYSPKLHYIPENIKEFSERLKCSYWRDCKTILDFNQKTAELKKIFNFFTIQSNQIAALAKDKLHDVDESFEQVCIHWLKTEKYDVTIGGFLQYANKLNEKLIQFKTRSPLVARKVFTYDATTLEPTELFPSAFPSKQLKRNHFFTKDMPLKKQRKEAFYESCFEALTLSEQEMVIENKVFF
ncbi:hypothetical protein A8135_13575 [Legionella jamestowniensis]|uniref:Protein kinase domain-containing protein n=1 Tax=Legionella jamestowniensis TaxID=455 RepID=A0ABX2XSP4_9GAMM|nr:protein kinase [Legionella jamestowniensis]OCH97635.1 hypothetical protein A8135_13575 [Legionella jamestowniensis]